MTEFEQERQITYWASQVASGEVSDGYHTHNELYKYRMLYHAHAVMWWTIIGVPVVKSWKHHDGERCFGGGWFIVSAELLTGQISNHYPKEDWEMFDCPEVERAPKWDGHTSEEAADRLMAAMIGFIRSKRVTHPDGVAMEWKHHVTLQPVTDEP